MGISRNNKVVRSSVRLFNVCSSKKNRKYIHCFGTSVHFIEYIEPSTNAMIITFLVIISLITTNIVHCFRRQDGRHSASGDIRMQRFGSTGSSDHNIGIQCPIVTSP
jgi:hypothetical protein